MSDGEEAEGNAVELMTGRSKSGQVARTKARGDEDACANSSKQPLQIDAQNGVAEGIVESRQGYPSLKAKTHNFIGGNVKRLPADGRLCTMVCQRPSVVGIFVVTGRGGSKGHAQVARVLRQASWLSQSLRWAQLTRPFAELVHASSSSYGSRQKFYTACLCLTM